jgi:hypothetical protein
MAAQEIPLAGFRTKLLSRSSVAEGFLAEREKAVGKALSLLIIYHLWWYILLRRSL